MENIKRQLRKSLPLDAWQRWEYKHTTRVIVCLVVFILLLDTSLMHAFFDLVRRLGYLGVFLSGVIFVSLFTAVPAVILILSFSGLNPLTVGAVAGLGAMVGDFLILKYLQEQVAYELKPIALRLGIPQAIGYLQGRKATLGIVRLLGAAIIASPLPDEIGIGLLGMGKISRQGFLVICYVLNAIGIFVIVSFGRSV